MHFLDRQPAVLRSIAVILVLIVSSGFYAPLPGLAAPAGTGPSSSRGVAFSASDRSPMFFDASPRPASQAAPGRPLPFRLGPPRPRPVPPARPATHTPLRVAGALAINEFPLPTTPITNPPGGPEGITLGPDGNLWFSIQFSSQIGRITPTGAVTVFDIPNVDAGPIDIARGPDNNMWFAEYGNSYVTDEYLGRISPVAPYTITQYPVPLLSAGNVVAGPTGVQLWGVTAGPDGNVWFTEYNNHAIGHMAPDGTGGVALSTPLGLTNPTDNPSVLGSYPSEITVGPDGNIWYADEGGGKIGMVPLTATKSSQIMEFALSDPGAGPCGIAAGPDGNIWFAEQNGPYIGKLSLQAGTYGSITYYATPTSMANPNEMTSARGALWVTEAAPNKIARVLVDGSFTEYSIPTASADPYGITLGPDGNLWFTELASNRIGQLVVAGGHELYFPLIER